MITRAQQLRDIASECESLAALAKDPAARKQMLDVAQQFERLARLRDYLGPTDQSASRDTLRYGTIEQISEPTHPSLKDLWAGWLAKRGSRIAPPRSAIRLDDELLSNFSLVEAVGAPPRFCYRHCEPRVAAGFGLDITGKFLDELDLGSGSLKTDMSNLYTKLMHQARPQVVHVRLVKRDGRHVKYERVALPLSEDGKAVNMFLFAYAFEREFSDHVNL